MTEHGEPAVSTTPENGPSDTFGFVTPLLPPAQAIAEQSLRAGAGIARGFADLLNTPGVGTAAVALGAGVGIAMMLGRKRGRR